ncbi:hypothetical protein KJ632_03600 [Patescibacteria group bacterium]|nr:hypothetical protein [Patescibacteria group bacterium]
MRPREGGFPDEAESQRKSEAARALFESHGFRQNETATIKKFNPRSQQWETHQGWRIAIVPSGVDGDIGGDDPNPALLAVNPNDSTDFVNISLQDLLELNR